MYNSPGLARIFCGLLILSNVMCAGCSALVAYTGEDVGKLVNKDQVHASFGTPTNCGNEAGSEFEEYRTRRKISEPTVAMVCCILDAETLGLFELWQFPGSVCQNTYTTIAGQTLRFEYAENGDVQRILVDGTPMNMRARLP
jgi:hypothetical protein